MLPPIRLRIKDNRLFSLRRALIDAYYNNETPSLGLQRTIWAARRYATIAGLKVSKTLDLLDTVWLGPEAAVVGQGNRLTGVVIPTLGLIPVRPVRLGSSRVAVRHMVLKLSTGTVTIYRYTLPPALRQGGAPASPLRSAVPPLQAGAVTGGTDANV